MAKETIYKLDNVSVRLVKEPPLLSRTPVTNPEAAISLVQGMLKEYSQEAVCVVCLHSDGKPISASIVSVGSINAAIACPREIFQVALLANAASILIFHNHPSGNLTPSAHDIEITEKLYRTGKILELPVLDHIIVGPDKWYFSFKEHGMLEEETKNG